MVNSEIGEVALWKAVLHTAITDMENEDYRLGAQAWFERDDFDVSSFLWVCEVTDICPRRVREGIANRKGRKALLGIKDKA